MWGQLQGQLPCQGSQSEELMYDRELDENDTNFTETHAAYLGAAGESSKKASERVEREQLGEKKVLRVGNSMIDKIIFGRDMDGSETDDHLEDQLYAGFGVRSKDAGNWADISTRRTDHMTDDKLYGATTGFSFVRSLM